MKHKGKQPEFKVREAPPKVVSTKKGVVVNCPFCNPTHTILPGVISACGTMLKVTAVQVYFSSHYTKHHGLKCLKCGQTGGEMLRYQKGYVHMQECAPGMKLITEPPPLSKLAGLVFKLPPKIREVIEKRTGFVKELQLLDEEGKPTGKVLGYFFWKEKVSNG